MLNVYMSRIMDMKDAISAFGALSQETRLQVFRYLVKCGPEGLPAGKVSQTLQIPHNTLSFHLAQLANAGLVQSRREGRSIIYSAHCAFFVNLIHFMVDDCCTKDVANIRKGKKKGCSVIEFMHGCNTTKLNNL